MDQSEARLGRAVGAASLSTFVALTLHVLAGGHAPALVGVVVPLIAATAVASQLAGRPLGRWRLAIIVSASQVALHAGFSLGDAPGPRAAMHHAHAGHAPAALVLEGPAPTDAVTPAHAASMPLAHVLAAVITYVAIRRAHVLLSVIAALGALLACALLGSLESTASALPPTYARIVPPPPPERSVAPVTLACRASRAPPAFA